MLYVTDCSGIYSMRYASVCSGVEAASLAWEPLGWEPVWFSQYDPEHNYKNGPDFPSAVLAAHWPHVPNLGDMTKLKQNEVYQNEQFDLLVGGTPCQDYSVAGLRKGLDGERGQLTLEFVRLLEDKQPRWFVWENVPGVLTSNKGHDFATFINDIKEVGYSICWRIIDAQYCGVPQRRRRIFVVGYLGDDWRPSAAVLIERQSMPGYFKPSRKTGQEVAKCVTGSAHSSLRADSDVVLNPFDMQRMGVYGDGHVASTCKARDFKDATDLVVHPNNSTVRRLTQVEGERLQGMPDHHTNIIWKGKPAPAGHRYKAIGNSMATVAMNWIGKRIDYVEGLING